MTLLDLFKNRASDNAFLAEVREAYWRALGITEFQHSPSEPYRYEDCEPVECRKCNRDVYYSANLTGCPIPDSIPPLVEAVEALRQAATGLGAKRLCRACRIVTECEGNCDPDLLLLDEMQRFLIFLAALTENV